MAGNKLSQGGGENDDVALSPMDCNYKPKIYDSKLWPNVKPFVEGGLAGAIIVLPSVTFSSIIVMTYKSLPYLHKCLLNLDFQNLNPAEKRIRLSEIDQFLAHKKTRNAMVKMTPCLLLMSTIQCATLFGSFGFLTKKVEAANKGMPLSLYQGVGCCLISGAAEAFVKTACCLSYSRTSVMGDATRISLTQDLYHTVTNKGILALWKGGRVIGTGFFASNVGMLASYNQSYDYLRESVCLSANNSVLGAGLVSGFVYSTCSYPFFLVGNTNRTYPCTGPLDCAFKILKLHGPLMFYRGSIPHILKVTTHVTILWYCLDKVKKIGRSYGW